MAVPVEALTSIFALATFPQWCRGFADDELGLLEKLDSLILKIHGGTEGSLSLPHPNWHGGPLKYAKPNGDWEVVPLDEEPLARLNWPPENPQHSNYRGIGIAEMIDAMGREVPHRTPSDLGAHVVEVADAIVASASTGATVSLKLNPPRPAPISGTESRGF